MMKDSATAARLAAVAHAAGQVIMRHYREGRGHRLKADLTPVTDADEEAEALILAWLAVNFPDVPVAAEEAVAAGRGCRPCAHFFLVDPLDGTREFLNRNGEFTVNVAEVRDGLAVAGAVYAPAKNRLFFGGHGSAFECLQQVEAAFDPGGARPIKARKPGKAGLVAIGSRSHGDNETEAFLKRFSIRERIVSGSSLKFCKVAAGEADIYARWGRTMEWDTAAGQAVLAAAGGTMRGWDGGPFLYGKPHFENGPFVARGMVE
ncbi:MAG: 3'(2'),5'-bisphosphate nucleotidase CysQ [Rhizomicrobium sp.]